MSEANQADHHPEVTVVDPDFWRTHADALAEALTDADGELAAEPPQSGVPKFVGRVARTAIRSAIVGAALLIGIRALPKPNQRRYTLTVEEAAERLGISRSFAYEAVRRGEIPHVKIGRRILVPIAALDRLLGQAGEADKVAE